MTTVKYINCLVLLTLIISVTACNSSSKKGKNTDNYVFYQEQGEIFATSFHIKYAYDRSLYDEIMAELNKFNLSLNPFLDNSIISKVNNNEEVELDSFFVEVFNKSMEVSEISGGKFDITVSPFINAWGFGFKEMDNVTPKIIDSLKEFVGYKKISLENGKIVKTDPRVQINTSAIAKGYSCDVIAKVLDSYGVLNYMVEIGGEISMKGKNDQGEYWRIGIDKPLDDSTAMHRDLQIILSIKDKSVATSGNYRNYYIKDGKKYAHTIDPQTGYPSEQNILGATVIADNCMTADAYATAFMAMGLDKSKEIASKVPGLFYYFIYSLPDGSVQTTYSDGFEQFFADKNDQ